MTWWGDRQIEQRAEELVVLADVVRETRPSVVVVAAVGRAEEGLGGLGAFFASIAPPGSAVHSTQDARPSGQIGSELATRVAAVYLSTNDPAVAFAYAAALQPGSILLLRSPGAPWPDFSRVSCARDSVLEGRLVETTALRREERAVPGDAPAPPIERRTLPRRPLRSVFLGDLSYCSAYRLGVGQGMAQLGAWHRDVSIRDDAADIDQQVREMAPDLIWTHMLLWPPLGGAPVHKLLTLAESWRKRFGAIVLVHDGDPRPRTRFPHDVSAAVDLALLNHSRPVPDWRVPSCRWLYAAFSQERIGDPVLDYRADLAFAGLMREDGDLYGPRTACVRALVERIGMRVWPDDSGINNRMLIADVAPSVIAMLGFGRPEAPGWVDTRVFSVPGAGGVLIHDDTGGVLEPHVHYVPCVRYDVDSVIEALAIARHRAPEIRRAAFEHVQRSHTWRHRCEQVVSMFFRTSGGGAA